MVSYRAPTVVILIISCALILSNAAPNVPLSGTWQLIKNVNDPDIQHLAKFALAEHNKLRGASLQLGRVLKVEQKGVSGMLYKLILSASRVDGALLTFEAIIWDKPWDNFRNLTSFRNIYRM